MSSKIKENLLFYLASTREKSRLIGINNDLDLKSDILIKLIIKNSRFKFDLLLIENLRSKFKEFKFENLYTFNYDLNELNFKNQIKKLENSIKNVYPDSCLIIDSINLLILNLNSIELNKFMNYLLSKYSKIIFIFNNEFVSSISSIQELCNSYFELNRHSFKNEIQVQFIYKKKCLKLGIDLLKGDYLFSFDQNTLKAKLIEKKTISKESTDDFYSYDLSFNLTIKDQDKQREQIVLPFMK